MISRFTFLLILAALSLSLKVYGTTKPDSGSAQCELFHIERSRDANVIRYELNFDEHHQLSTDKPVKAYWVKYAADGCMRPLTWVQRKYAYGLNFEYVSSDSVVFTFVSYKKRTFELVRDVNGLMQAYTVCKGERVKVEKIFVQIDGGSFWLPEISKVELHGIDPKTQVAKVEVIRP